MLTKSNILLNLQCKRRLWLSTYCSNLAVDDADAQSRMQSGNEVGSLARELSPEGEFIDTKKLEEALERTHKVINATPNRPLFEPAFKVDDLLVRVDLLYPTEYGYKLVEVKSSTSVKPYYLKDVAIQTWVMQKAQPKTIKSFVSHINNEFMYMGGNQYTGYFTEVDVTESIQDHINEVPQWTSDAKATIALKTEPINIKTGTHCTKPFTCSFMEHCRSLEESIEYPIDILPYGRGVIERLKSEGYKDLREVPDDVLEKKNHIVVHRVTKSGISELDAAAKIILDRLSYPRYYLDFETINYAIPKISNTKPFSQIVFQWSCHIENKGEKPTHQEFLDDNSEDPRRAFADSLITLLGKSGTIFVYSGFEESRINELCKLFPDLQKPLKEIEDRIFDLLKLSRDHYYHPDMKGSWSIKKLLPTISELNYKDLAVQNGGMAQEAYKKLISTTESKSSKEQIKLDLLLYCKQDTQALVDIVETFSR